MIRTVGKTITVNKYIMVDELITQEKIIEIHEWPDSKKINVLIGSINSEGIVVKTEEIDITNNDYDLLFSEKEVSSEEKTSYREVDLWKVIDKLRE